MNVSKGLSLKLLISRTLLVFLCVGCVATLLNYSVFSLLFVILQTNYLVASAVGFISGAVLGYILNKSLTFKDTSSFSLKVFMSYIAVNVVSLSLSLILLEVLVRSGVNPLVANFFCIGLTAVTNYLGIKKFVFVK